MANEITRIISMAASKGGASISTGSQSDSIDMDASGVDMATSTQNVQYNGTTAEQLAYNTTDFASSQKVHFVAKNLSDTYDVTIWTGATEASEEILSVLGPGESCALSRVDISQIYFDAETPGPALIQWWAVEV